MSLLTPAALERFREERGEPAILAAFVLGVVAGAVHPGGLVAAGAFLGLVAPTFRRALLYGLYLGGLVLLVFAMYLLWFGTLGRVAGTGPLAALSLAVSLGLPTLAAGGVRGLV